MASTTMSLRGLNFIAKANLRSAGLHYNNSWLSPRHNICCNVSNISKLNRGKYRSFVINKNYFSSEALKTKAENTPEDKSLSTFQQMMHFRKRQAQNSVLIELRNNEDIPSAVFACEQFGAIKNLYSYCGESQNVFLLLEFTDESSIKKLFNECQNENISDAFAISSRILNFKKKFHQDIPKLTLDVNEDITTTVKNAKPRPVSELIEDIYLSEKLSDLNTRLRFFFCGLLKDSISGLFPHCDVYPFGSTVNGMGRHGSDLDIMIRMYPMPSQNYQCSEFSFLNKTCIGSTHDLQRRTVHALGDFFGTFLPGFSSVKKILHARVPILKFKHKVLGMECDISVNNMSAVLMSEMLFFCGEIDSRVRPLLYAVKKWAKETSITYEVPGSWITNFGLSLLVIFFLQNRPIPILPCLNDAIKVIGSECSSNFKLEYLAPLADLQAKASLNTESLAILLQEFLAFLGTHPFENKHISVLSGLATEEKFRSAIWIQYPLEEDKNVTKNMSQNELHDMCEKARLSSKYLTAYLQLKDTRSKDLSVILGVPNILKAYANKSKRFDVSAMLMEESVKNSKRRTDKRHAF